MSEILKLGVSTGDMAGFTGMSQRFIQDEIQEGELRAARFGRALRIPADEAKRYLQSKGWPLPSVLDPLDDD